MNVNR